MLFNSYHFIFVFLPVVLAGFLLLARRSMASAMLWLAIASVFFYGYWSMAALPVLLLSIIFNYVAGVRILSCESPRLKRWLMRAAIAVDLAALGVFKYANFISSSFYALIGSDSPPDFSIALPIGISFFTFTQIAYIVDCYKGLAGETRLSHYTLFVSFFPHLVAGPILHHGQMMPQFASRKLFRLSAETTLTALIMFAIGLAKKTLLADPLGDLADGLFNAVDRGGVPDFGGAWIGVLAYTFQIYFDFSAYSDMAIGISLLFGIALPINFNSPYKATSIVDFWRRWHITLSNFLRDYLYIPLGGNRHGSGRRYLNLLITMLLGGLWHGAGWTFVVWGGLHGCYLVINHLWEKGRPAARRGGRLAWAITFLSVVFAWVFFRSSTLAGALHICDAMKWPHGSDLHVLSHWLRTLPSQDAVELFEKLKPFLFISLAFYISLKMPSSAQIAMSAPNMAALNRTIDARAVSPGIAGVLAAGLLFGASLAWISGVSKFLYFQF
ncbi:MAG: alginate O-acetyltransferase [Betaproteobacteria bacterium]|nr:alginate O-acetyltransferase [Betaproteobacteria bacterium]